MLFVKSGLPTHEHDVFFGNNAVKVGNGLKKKKVTISFSKIDRKREDKVILLQTSQWLQNDVHVAGFLHKFLTQY